MIRNNSKTKQQGAALVVSLFILLILTVLGVTSMRTTILGERMVSNERNRAIALQAAESALRDAETNIAALQFSDGFGGIAGEYARTEDEDDPFDETKWTDTESAQATSDIVPTGAPARLKMKELSRINDDGSLNVSGYDGNIVSPGITNFRVSARGVGGDATAEIILQTHVGARVR